MQQRHYQELIDIFSACFGNTESTLLVAGKDEPFYQPAAQGERFHRVVFGHGFYASALHEVSHWCIAGKVRRLIFDYGYWYRPDGRSAVEQAAFEQVERKPQALEWLFSLCADVPFRVSVDNLSGIEVDRAAFANAVKAQLLDYYDRQLPVRAECFARALCDFYHTRWPVREQILELVTD
ncbi:elongation factor P hydroxylase [Idiomarina seosinensis]|uniref:elongation factor P hydroxylase n=1 Tax=Idiomarina seosinensis TaxID=281739 RepID=UPI00384E9F8E